MALNDRGRRWRERQLTVWDCIEEADGVEPTPRVDLVAALTNLREYERATFARTDLAELVRVGRGVETATGRAFAIDAKDARITVSLRPRRSAYVDLQPGDVLWGELDKDEVLVVHRRVDAGEGLVRVIMSSGARLGWHPADDQVDLVVRRKRPSRPRLGRRRAAHSGQDHRSRGD